jgi:hypothetical protein
VKDPNQNYNQTWQYPAQAVDAYTPDFNTSEFIHLCQGNNVGHVLLYEYNDWQYFNSTLTEKRVQDMLNETGRFGLQATFGMEPNRIFVMSFA